jgi:hypothetical protein
VGTVGHPRLAPLVGGRMIVDFLESVAYEGNADGNGG